MVSDEDILKTPASHPFHTRLSICYSLLPGNPTNANMCPVEPRDFLWFQRHSCVHLPPFYAGNKPPNNLPWNVERDSWPGPVWWVSDSKDKDKVNFREREAGIPCSRHTTATAIPGKWRLGLEMSPLSPHAVISTVTVWQVKAQSAKAKNSPGSLPPQQADLHIPSTACKPWQTTGSPARTWVSIMVPKCGGVNTAFSLWRGQGCVNIPKNCQLIPHCLCVYMAGAG